MHMTHTTPTRYRFFGNYALPFLWTNTRQMKEFGMWYEKLNPYSRLAM